jgi:beta-galactosidase
MYIGGTDFGYMNSAEGEEKGAWSPVTTSYDYDAMLSEIGDMTWKYQRTRETIQKYYPFTPKYVVKNNTKKSYGNVTFSEGCSILDALADLTYNSSTSTTPIPLQELNVGYGFGVYKTDLSYGGGNLSLPWVRDEGIVIIGDKRIGSIVGHGKEINTTLPIPAGQIIVLVDIQGRPKIISDTNSKGLLHTPQLDGKELSERWTSIGLDTNRVTQLKWKTTLPTKIPAFYRTTFKVDEIADTFLNPTGWVRGVAWVNGFNLGRYWTIGPQLTLYVPAGLLHVGDNELIVFELVSDSESIGTMSFDDVHQLDIIK